MLDEIDISKRLIWILYILLQQIVAIITGNVISFTFHADLSSLWVWHEVLSSIGVIFLMFEGLLIFSPENHLAYGLQRTTINQIHGYIVGIGLAFISIGNIFIIVKKEVHFASAHGILGLISWILCAVSMVSGILAYFSKFFQEKISPILLMFSHTLLGLIAFLCSLAALASGFYMLIHEKHSDPSVMMALTALTGVAVLIISGRTLFILTKLFFDQQS